MGNQEKMHISSSLGSQAIGSDSSSSSDDDELMDEDMDESYVTTPQVNKIGPVLGPGSGGTFGSPAMSSLMSFQQDWGSVAHLYPNHHQLILHEPGVRASVGKLINCTFLVQIPMRHEQWATLTGLVMVAMSFGES
jgi:hypothetical protein